MKLNDGTVAGGLVWSSEEEKRWSPVAAVLGGLGFTTIMDQSSDGTWELMGSDVAGLWRRDLLDHIPRWRPCITPSDSSFTMDIEGDGKNVYSHAMAKTDPNVAYAFRANKVVRTSDRGLSWVDCPGLSNLKRAFANAQQGGTQRMSGDKLAVDPYHADHILVASPGMASYNAAYPGEGVYWSTDGGDTAQLLAGIPAPPSTSSLIMVAFDPSQAAVNGRCPRAYVYVAGMGVYRVDGLGSATPVAVDLDWEGGVWASTLRVDHSGRLLISPYNTGSLGILPYTVAGGWGAPLATHARIRTFTEIGTDGTKFLVMAQTNTMSLYNNAAMTTTSGEWSNDFRFRVKANRCFVAPARINISNSLSMGSLYCFGDTIYFTQGLGLLKASVAAAETDPEWFPWEDDTYGQEMLVNNVPKIFTLRDGAARGFQSSHDKACIPRPRRGEGRMAANQTWPQGFYHGMTTHQSSSNPDLIGISYYSSSQPEISENGGQSFRPYAFPFGDDIAPGDAIPGRHAGEMLLRLGQNRWPRLTFTEGADGWPQVNLFNSSGEQIWFRDTGGTWAATLTFQEGDLPYLPDGVSNGFGFTNHWNSNTRAVPHPTKPGVFLLLNATYGAPNLHGGIFENTAGSRDFVQKAGWAVHGAHATVGDPGYNGSIVMDSAGFVYVNAGSISSGERQDATVHIVRYDTNQTPWTRTVLPYFNETIWMTVGAPAPGSDMDTLWAIGWKNFVYTLAYSPDRGTTWFNQPLPDMVAPPKVITASRSNFGELLSGSGAFGMWAAEWQYEMKAA